MAIETEIARCELCGEPMPAGEEMFKFHGYSGDCPKPALPSKLSFDTRCLDLAQYFLGSKNLRDKDSEDELAQCVQDAVEGWFADQERKNEAAYERQQQSLMESGGPDDSSYRRDIIAAGRGHLLR